MADIQLIPQLKYRITTLQSSLIQKQKILDQYKFIQTQADTKIKGIQKIHAQKIKSLLNSISILKKQKVSIEGKSKQHKRSKLIQQLNKQILDQDIAIQAVRKYVYQNEGKEKGREVLDKIIVDALKKGPERIRPQTRQELRMQIEKLKSLQFKNKEEDKKKGAKGGHGGQIQEDSISRISSVMSDNSGQTFASSTQQLLERVRDLQLESQNLKIQSNTKTKIIEKLKTQIKQSDKYKAEYELLKNQLQISQKKMMTFQKLLKQNKQSIHKKVVDLYQRQLKVQQLQMIGQQDKDRLRSVNQSHNILLQQMKIQKQQLQAVYDQLKQQNDKLILDNVHQKKTQQNQNVKLQQIRKINNKQKQELETQLGEFKTQATRLIQQKQELKAKFEALSNKYFQQSGQWIQQRQQMRQQLNETQGNTVQSDKINRLMQQIDELKQKNKKLSDAVGSGTGEGQGDDKILLERLNNYKLRVEYLQGRLDPKSRISLDQKNKQLFDLYDQLCIQFSKYKQGLGGVMTKDTKRHRKNIIEVTRKDNARLNGISSSIDSLNLADVDSQILDNFDTDYDYSIRINDFEQGNMPKISQADRQLLKLIDSDLWYFCKNDQVAKKIQQVSRNDQEFEDFRQQAIVSQQIRKLRNMSHPQGQKVTLYEQQLKKLDNISDSVSITSAVNKQFEGYDSDVNIEVKRLQEDLGNLNYNFKDLSMSIGSDVPISSVESGDSNIKRRKKPVEKATKLNFASKGSIHSSEFDSQIDVDMLNSDVSSIGVSERGLNKLDSDVEGDFRKKRR